MEPGPEGGGKQGWRRWLDHPEIPRALPFVLFLVLTSLQGKFFAGSEYWLYAVKTLLAGAMLWALRGWLPEWVARQVDFNGELATSASPSPDIAAPDQGLALPVPTGG